MNTIPDPAGLAPLPDAQPARTHRRWLWPAAAGAALVLGVAIGGASSGDEAQIADLESASADLKSALSRAEQRAATAEDRAETAESANVDLTSRAAELDERKTQLDTRAAELDEREAALSATEQAVAASQIGIGIWTVGVDVEPGTYRTTEPVASTCYWGIYRTGTNQDDIIQNDIVTGGRPTVTLSKGQDFKNDCGTWSKQ